MAINRREFLRNTSIAAAGLVGGAGVVGRGAFAAYPAPAISDVSFIGANAAYVSPNNGKTGRRGMIYDVLLPFASRITAGMAGKKVVIKPNCVTGTGAQAVLNCTHVDALRGVIDFLRYLNPSLQITIAEASAGTTSTMYTSSVLNYTALLSDFTGITLVDLNTNQIVNSSGGNGGTAAFPSALRHLWQSSAMASTWPIYASSAFLDPGNYILTICRPKTHNCMVLTGTTKNMSMGMPLTTKATGNNYSGKASMHAAAGGQSGTTPAEDQGLAGNIFQLANIYRRLNFPNMAVLDAWEGEQGEGPHMGTSVMQYCAVASEDMLAVDRIGAKLMGFSDIPTPSYPPAVFNPSYTDPRYLVWCSNGGLGNYDLNKINLLNSASWSSVSTYAKTYALAKPLNNNNFEDRHGEAVQSSDRKYAGAYDPYYLDPKPYLTPQANYHDGEVGEHIPIHFSMPAGYPIRVAIADEGGKIIRHLGSEFMHHGSYGTSWDRRDELGSRVPAGNYQIKLQFGSRELIDRITLA